MQKKRKSLWQTPPQKTRYSVDANYAARLDIIRRLPWQDQACTGGGLEDTHESFKLFGPVALANLMAGPKPQKRRHNQAQDGASGEPSHRLVVHG
jgi:hypothetical protein